MGRHESIAALAAVNAEGPGGAPLELADVATGRGRTVRAILAAARLPLRVHAVDEASDLDDDVLHDPRVRSVIADLGEPLPFAEDSLDRVVSLNVAEHVREPAEHVRDCYRVLRPHGLLVLAHSDWDTALFTGEDDLLTRRLVDRFASDVPAWAQRADGFMGRKIVPLAVDSPFEIVTIETWADCHRRFDEGSVGWKVAMGVLAAARDDERLATQAEQWLAGLRRMAAADRFLFTVTDVAAVLRKP